MRFKELVLEMDDSETDHHAEKIKKLMLDRGWKVLGQGSWAMVFEKGPLLVKAYGLPHKLDQMQGFEYDPVEFVNAANKLRAQGNKCVPKFGTVHKIGSYTLVPTERLNEYSKTPNWDNLFDYVLHDNSRNPLRKQRIENIKQLVPDWQQMATDYDQAINYLCNLHNCDDLDNAGNTMWRGDWPVINDPWASTNF